jgi:hypothetical protein
MTVNGKWETMWKEIIITRFKVLSYHVLGENDHEHPS